MDPRGSTDSLGDPSRPARTATKVLMADGNMKFVKSLTKDEIIDSRALRPDHTYKCKEVKPGVAMSGTYERELLIIDDAVIFVSYKDGSMKFKWQRPLYLLVGVKVDQKDSKSLGLEFSASFEKNAKFDSLIVHILVENRAELVQTFKEMSRAVKDLRSNNVLMREKKRDVDQLMEQRRNSMSPDQTRSLNPGEVDHQELEIQRATKELDLVAKRHSALEGNNSKTIHS